MPPLPIDAWLADQLRLSIFPVPTATPPMANWWELLVGAPPDERNENPKKGSAVIAGLLPPGKFVLALQPDRIDWLLVPPDPDLEIPTPDVLPDLGRFAAALQEFSRLVEAWLVRNDVPDVARIAFGAVVKHYEDSRSSGYQRLPDYVPIRVSPDSSDFLYQINLPVDSRTGVERLQINRLSKWSIVALRRFSATVNVGSGRAHQDVSEPIFAFRTEVDINSAPSFERPLPRERLVDIYRELANFGLEIVTSGIIGR